MLEARRRASWMRSFTAIWPQDPVEVLGVPQGAYLNGYGAGVHERR